MAKICCRPRAETGDRTLHWRIDLIAIDVDSKGIVERLEHLENIVEEE